MSSLVPPFTSPMKAALVVLYAEPSLVFTGSFLASSDLPLPHGSGHEPFAILLAANPHSSVKPGTTKPSQAPPGPPSQFSCEHAS